MSHNSPVFFLPISTDEIPHTLDNWHVVENLLNDKWEKRQQNGLRMSVSRNWWHQHAISLICKHLQIRGLEFLQSEIACLDAKQIEFSLIGINKLLAVCHHGIPELTPEMEETGSILTLRYYNEMKKIKFSTDQVEKAFSEAQPILEIEGLAEDGYNALVEFFTFLKSLKQTLIECLAQNNKLLYVQTLP